MRIHKAQIQTLIIVALIMVVSYLHYATRITRHHSHIVYRELYFIPIVLAAFWFGLRGALLGSLAVTIGYAPFVYTHWQGFSPEDLNRIRVIVIFNCFAVIVGGLKDRENREHERLMKAQNLASMGKALASVAHDMKTPIIAIGGFANLVANRLGDHDPDYEKLQLVIGQARRLEKMIQEMLDFSRPLDLDKSANDIHKIIEESIDICKHAAESRNVTIEFHQQRGLPPVHLDGMRMQQVFINLLMNALQASPEGGIVSVCISNDDNAVIVDINDCGCGIDPKLREDVFVPFYTTKKEGTGLGLAIVKKIIDAHRGEIEILRNENKGATFRVTLPF